MAPQSPLARGPVTSKALTSPTRSMWVKVDIADGLSIPAHPHTRSYYLISAQLEQFSAGLVCVDINPKSENAHTHTHNRECVHGFWGKHTLYRIGASEMGHPDCGIPRTAHQWVSQMLEGDRTQHLLRLS